MSSTPDLTFCRLEYLTEDGWAIGHHGVRLLYPDRYPERLADKGKIGRVIDLDTGEVFTGPLEPLECGLCGTQHTGPEGSCLI